MAYVIDVDRPHMGGNLPGGDDNTFCPRLWRALVSRYDIGTVIDVGCGTGEALRFFRREGCLTLGIEGLAKNAEKCPPPVLVADLAEPVHSLPDWDLVWCCEVVEHIEQESVDNLLRTITCGKMLAMTHAVPGQVGWHHVNNQLPEYWIEKIEATGKKYEAEITEWARAFCPAGNYFRQSGMIFR